MARLRILVVNAGSTSLKLSVVDDDDSSTSIDSLESAQRVTGVAHRIVHGGERFYEAVVVDATVERELAALTELAPLHNGPALEALAHS